MASGLLHSLHKECQNGQKSRFEDFFSEIIFEVQSGIQFSSASPSPTGTL